MKSVLIIEALTHLPDTGRNHQLRFKGRGRILLCRLMGKPEMVEDERFDDMAGLRAHHNEVDQIIGAWTPTQDPISLFHRLHREGITAGHVMHEEHAFADPHVKERGFFVSITAPEVGTYL